MKKVKSMIKKWKIFGINRLGEIKSYVFDKIYDTEEEAVESLEGSKFFSSGTALVLPIYIKENEGKDVN